MAFFLKHFVFVSFFFCDCLTFSLLVQVLAFYCDVQSLNLDVFDLSSADSSMLPLLDELRQLIVLLYQPKT